jgi:DNA modification methylase
MTHKRLAVPKFGFEIDSAVYYHTALGAAYLGDSLQLLKHIPDGSVNLIMTSPPYALHFKKEYGNADQEEYVKWFLPFAREFHRVLRDNGSLVVDIGGSYQAGQPTRSLYHFKLLIALCDEIRFHLAQEFFWYNPARLPAPAEWVNVRRIRVKDSVNCVWWLSKTPFPKADNRKVLQPYSKDMERLIKRGYKAKKRPSGHNITSKFRKDHGGSIPPNILILGNNESNGGYLKACQEAGLKVHPARFPKGLPRFFVRFLTDPEDLVIDPFAGSNTTGAVCEQEGRRWLAMEIEEEYLTASKLRFAPFAPQPESEKEAQLEIALFSEPL